MYPSTSVKKYIGVFLLMNMIGAMILGLLKTFFNFDLGIVATIGILIAASFGTTLMFVKAKKRAPEPSEKRRLVWGCFMGGGILTILGLLLSILLESGYQGVLETFTSLQENASLPRLGIAIGLSMSLVYLMLTLAFGWYARRVETNLSKKTM